MSENTPMQTALLKVLATMNMEMEDKVLISLKLTTDKQIITFLRWLKANVSEEQVRFRQNEIIMKAIEIAKTM